jgi:hypothetical protein
VLDHQYGIGEEEAMSEQITDDEFEACHKHFSDYVAGPGYDVLRALEDLRVTRSELANKMSENAARLRAGSVGSRVRPATEAGAC